MNQDQGKNEATATSVEWVTSNDVAPDDPRVVRALDEYLAALDQGLSIDRETFIQRHPSIGATLTKCLAGLDFVARTAPQIGHAIAAPHESESSQRADAQLGVPLGDFLLKREIGRGGMGIVYEAEQLSLARRVAIKVLPLGATLDHRALQRFRNETMAVAQLDHPNIVDVFGVGCERGVHFYAMRFVDGSTLMEIIGQLSSQDATSSAGAPDSLSDLVVGASAAHERLDNNQDYASYHEQLAPGDRSPLAITSPQQPLAAETKVPHDSQVVTRRSFHRPTFFRSIAELGIQVAEALDHAHQLGVIHRDIKPSNLMVDARGKVWVTDFGLARIETAAGMTATGDILGTLRYMSPEQALAKRVLVDNRADLYSLGVTLYELLTLRPAFPAEDRRELIRQIAFEKPPAPHRLNKAVPVELETIVGKAMAKNPAERYATAQELADDLRRFLDDKPILARPPSLANRSVKLARRHKFALAATALLVLLTAIGSSLCAILLAYEHDKTEEALETSNERGGQLEISVQQTERERLRAEENFQRAREAVDRMFTRAAYEMVGQPHMEQIRRRLLNDALEFYQGFLQQKGDDPAVRYEAAMTYARVGNINIWLGEYDKGWEPLELAREMLAKLAKQFPADATYQVDLAVVDESLAYAALWLRRNADHLEHRRNEVTIYEELLRQFPTNGDYLRDLSKAQAGYAAALRVVGRPKEAVEQFEKSLESQKKQLADFPDIPTDNVRLAHFHHWYGMALQSVGRVDDAEREYRTALELRKQQLAEMPNDAGRKHSLTHIQSYLAMLLANNGRAGEAADLLTEASAKSDELLSEFPDVADYRRRAAFDHSSRGAVLMKMQRTAEATSELRRALQIWEDSIKDTPGANVVRDEMVWSQYDLGIALQAMRQPEEAAGQFRSAIAGLKNLESEYVETPKYKNDLGWMLATCPAIQFRDPNRAVELAKRALQLAPGLSDNWVLLGVAEYRAGHATAAIEALDKATELANADDPKIWLFLAMAEWQQGSHAKAQEWYAKANTWIDKRQPLDESLYRFRDEAAGLLHIEATAAGEVTDRAKID